MEYIHIYFYEKNLSYGQDNAFRTHIHKHAWKIHLMNCLCTGYCVRWLVVAPFLKIDSMAYTQNTQTGILTHTLFLHYHFKQKNNINAIHLDSSHVFNILQCNTSLKYYITTKGFYPLFLRT